MSSVTNKKVRGVGKVESAAEMEMCGRKRKNDTYMNSEDTKSSDNSDNSSLVQRKGAFLLFLCTSSGSTDVKMPDYFKIKLYYRCL